MLERNTVLVRQLSSRNVAMWMQPIIAIEVPGRDSRALQESKVMGVRKTQPSAPAARGMAESCWAQTATETQVTALDTRFKYSRRAYVLQLFPVYNTGDCPVCAVGYKSEPPTIVGHGRLLTIQLYTERSPVPRGLSLHLSTTTELYVGFTRPLLLFAIVSWKTKDARMTQS